MDNFKSFKKGVAMLMSTAMVFGTNSVYGMKKPQTEDIDSGFREVFDLEEKMEETQEKVIKKSQENLDKARVVIIGPSGSGKSTLRNLLSNIELVYQENPKDIFGEVFVIPRDSSFMKASGIGYGAEAVTFLPNLDVDNTNNVIYCDCPGFFDSHGPEREFINLHAIKALFKKPNKIKILVVIGADVFMTKNGRGKGLVDVVKKLNDIFPDKNSLKDSLALVITHVDRKYTVEAYEEALKGILQAWSNEANLDILEFLAQNPDRIFLFPNGKVGDKVEIIGKEKDKDLSAFLCDGKYVENLEFESKPSAEMEKYLEKISNALIGSMLNLNKSFGNIITDILDQAHNDVTKLKLLEDMEGMVEEIINNNANIFKFLELLNCDDTRKLLSSGKADDLKTLFNEAERLFKVISCLEALGLENFKQYENEIYGFILKYQGSLSKNIKGLEKMKADAEEIERLKLENEAITRKADDLKKQLSMLLASGEVKDEMIKGLQSDLNGLKIEIDKNIAGQNKVTDDYNNTVKTNIQTVKESKSFLGEFVQGAAKALKIVGDSAKKFVGWFKFW